MDATINSGWKPQSTRPRISTMPDILPLNSMPAIFSPLAKALLDGFSEGVIVFDVDGRLLYANQPAREALAGMDLS
jgi:PAS domain-containing protein